MHYHDNDDKPDVTQEHRGTCTLKLPIRERSDSSISTTLSGVSSASGTDGAPSSRQSSVGHSGPLVDHGQALWAEVQKHLERKRYGKEMEEDALCLREQDPEPTSECARPIVDSAVETLQGGIKCVGITGEQSRTVIHKNDPPPPPHTQSSLFRKHSILTLFMAATLMSWHILPSYTAIILALLGITILCRGFIRTLVVNPILRCIVLSHVAWKTASTPIVYPLLVFIMYTIYSIVRSALMGVNETPVQHISKTTQFAPNQAHSKTRISCSALFLLIGIIKGIAIISMAASASLLLCCAYAIWDHEEPAFLAPLSIGLLALSQIVLDASRDIITHSHVIGEPKHRGREMEEEAAFSLAHGLRPDPCIDDKGPTLPEPSSTVPTRRPFGEIFPLATYMLLKALSSSLRVLTYVMRGVAACAWLLLWHDIDAHRLVLHVATIHHRLLV